MTLKCVPGCSEPAVFLTMIENGPTVTAEDSWSRYKINCSHKVWAAPPQFYGQQLPCCSFVYFTPKLHQGLPLSLSLQVMTSVQRDSFVAKTPSVKTGTRKRNVNAGAAMPPSTGIPHTVKVGHLSVRCLELYWWQYVSCCSVSNSMWWRLL